MFLLNSKLIWTWFKENFYSFQVEALEGIPDLNIKPGDILKIRYYLKVYYPHSNFIS